MYQTPNRSPGIAQHKNKRKFKVYNIENKQLIGEFESTTECAEFLGIRSVVNYINTKCRCKTNKLGFPVAIR